jgi:deoxycytidine triphosphate deaminase
MYLADSYFRANIKDLIRIEDGPAFEEKQFQPSSIDLRLSAVIYIPTEGEALDLNAGKPEVSEYAEAKKLTQDSPYVLKPGHIILGSTLEYINTPKDCTGIINAKSTPARCLICVTFSNYINPGYTGHFPLQIANFGKRDFVIYPYMSICQLSLVKVEGSIEKPYEEARNTYVDDKSPLAKIRLIKNKTDALRKEADNIYNNMLNNL